MEEGRGAGGADTGEEGGGARRHKKRGSGGHTQPQAAGASPSHQHLMYGEGLEEHQGERARGAGDVGKGTPDA